MGFEHGVFLSDEPIEHALVTHLDELETIEAESSNELICFGCQDELTPGNMFEVDTATQNNWHIGCAKGYKTNHPVAAVFFKQKSWPTNNQLYGK